MSDLQQAQSAAVSLGVLQQGSCSGVGRRRYHAEHTPDPQTRLRLHSTTEERR